MLSGAYYKCVCMLGPLSTLPGFKVAEVSMKKGLIPQGDVVEHARYLYQGLPGLTVVEALIRSLPTKYMCASCVIIIIIFLYVAVWCLLLEA